MAGHSINIYGRRLFIDYPDAYGEASVNGKTWRWDFHHYCGPLFLRKNGEPSKYQSPPKAVWDAFEKWHKTYTEKHH